MNQSQRTSGVGMRINVGRSRAGAIARGFRVALASSLLCVACERAPLIATVEGHPDAAVVPVALTPLALPGGIRRFDCVSTQADQRSLSLRGWGAAGPAGSALQLKGNDLSCEVQLQSDCIGQAEVRVSAGLARSEKVVTAASPDQTVSVQLRLPTGGWERAIEPSDGTPYTHVLQLVARAQVRCAAPIVDPRPRYWTESFIAGLAGDRPRPSTPPDEGVVEDNLEEGDGPAASDSPAARRAADGETPGEAATDRAEAASARAAKAERRAKTEPAAATEKTAEETAAEAARARRAARREKKRQLGEARGSSTSEPSDAPGDAPAPE